jgi:hypothetical protein
MGAKLSSGGHERDILFQRLEMWVKHSRGGHKHKSLLQSLEIGQNILEVATNTVAYFGV